MTYIKILLYCLGTIGSGAVILSTLNIQRDFIQEHLYYFMVPLWIAIIGLFAIKKYELRKTEQQMRQK